MSSGVRGRWGPLVVLVAAVAALLSSLLWVAASGGVASWGPGRGMTMPMMGGPGVVPGAGPVHDLAGARRAAQRFADPWGLGVGEVMQFSDNYYAELLDSAGRGATEVLIDPGSGVVQLEWGPAMMWNTAYGMMPAGGWPGAAPLSSEQARRVADRWLRHQRFGLRAGDAEAFPGYYTLHTLRGGQVVGMLSVHARTGQVWYHTWHGRFLRMQDRRQPPGVPRPTP